MKITSILIFLDAAKLIWSSVASFSQSSAILRRLYIIMKDRKTSTDLQFTHIEVQIFKKLVGISLSSVFEIQMVFEVAKTTLKLKNFPQTRRQNYTLLRQNDFTLSPKHT